MRRAPARPEWSAASDVEIIWPPIAASQHNTPIVHSAEANYPTAMSGTNRGHGLIND